MDEETQIAVVCTVLGGFLLLFGLTSFLVRGKLFLSTAVIAIVFGIILGPKVLKVLYVLPENWEDEAESDRAKNTLLWFTRVVLGIQILSAGVTLPSRIILKGSMVKSLAVLLAPVMLFAVLVGGALAKAAFPEIRWTECFVISACLAPTDPVLAASVVKGVFAERHVPPYIRDLLLLESGINDGFGTPFWLLPVALISSDSPIKEFFVTGIIEDTILASLGGFALGHAVRTMWNAAKRREWVDKESRLVWTLALALFTTGLFELIGWNELIACFFCGVAMDWDGELHEDDLHSHFSEGIDAILDVSVFTTLGTVLPWSVWLNPDPPVSITRLVGFAIGILALRRIPAVLALARWMPEIRTMREAIFVGWFGPMGIGAIYYALKASERFEPGHVLKQELFGIISWVVFLSTIVHGITIPVSLLSSAMHPSFHPRFLVRADPADEETPLLSNSNSDEAQADTEAQDEDRGYPIERTEIERILGESHLDDRVSITSNQQEQLVGKGGLGAWGRGRISVYDEGNCLMICDEDGNVSVRRISKKA